MERLEQVNHHTAVNHHDEGDRINSEFISYLAVWKYHNWKKV
jgi:hypothetical protein